MSATTRKSAEQTTVGGIGASPGAPPSQAHAQRSRLALPRCTAFALVIAGAVAFPLRAALAQPDPTPTTVHVALDEAFVRGSMRPNTTFTLTLRSATGDVRSVMLGVSDERGEFELATEPFTGPRERAKAIASGDVVWIEESRDDPLVVEVPPLTATYDDATGILAVGGLPGARLQVLRSAPDGEVLAEAVADANGAHAFAVRALFPAGADDVSGWVRMETREGHAFYRSWSESSLSVLMAQAVMLARGPRGTAYSATLTSPSREGLRVSWGTEQEPAHGFDELRQTKFGAELWFVDAYGRGVAPMPGDTVTYRVDDRPVLAFEIPPLEATVNVQRQTVDVRTAPAHDVRLLILGQPRAQQRSDAAGDVRFMLGADAPLRHLDLVEVEIGIARNTVRHAIQTAGLTLDLDTGQFDGSIGVTRAAIAVDVVHARGGTNVSRFIARTDRYGGFRGDLGEPHGNARRSLAAGDRVTVRVDAPGYAEAYAVEIPEHTVAIDAAREVIHGIAPLGSVLRLRDAPRFFERASRGDTGPVEVGEDGRYAFDASGSRVLAPGVIIAVEARLASGNQVVRRQMVPQVLAQVGGGLVCALVGRERVLHVTQRRDGEVIGSHSAPSDRHGLARGALRTADGTPSTIAAGDEVDVSVESNGVPEWSDRVVVPMLDLDVDWDEAELVVRGEPTDFYVLTTNVGTCRQQPILGDGGGYAARNPDASGRVEHAGSLVRRRRGEGIEVLTREFTPWRWFRQAIRPQLVVHRDTGRIEAVGTPRRGITMSIEADGGGRASWSGAFDDHGEANWAERPMRLRHLEAGTRIGWREVEGDGGELILGQLSWDFDDMRGIVGRAEPTDQLMIGIERAGQSTDWRTIPLDDEGRFTLSEADLPSTGDRTLASVVSLTLRVLRDDGHVVVSTLRVPGRAPRTVYLPLAMR